MNRGQKTMQNSYSLTHNNKFYIASCVKDGGVYLCEYSNGAVNIIDKTPMDMPMYMLIEDNKMYVLLKGPFADNDESGLVTYDINPDGTLCNPSEVISTKGKCACHLCLSDESVYCTNYVSGSVVKLPEGKLSVHSGKGVDLVRQESAHTHFVCETPDKNYILATDLGLDKIFVYDKDLSIVSTVDMPKGHGPRHLIFHDDATTLFCVNELKSTVSVLKYNSGELKLIGTTSALPEGYNGKTIAAAIRTDGNYVYTSNRGHDSISIMEYKNDSLSLLKNVHTYGANPRDFWNYDDIFLCTNQNGNNVTLVSKADGNLLTEIAIPEPLAVLPAYV